ncbi:MAG: hypothetical protein RR280_08530 [Bacteroidaceae bacterium]
MVGKEAPKPLSASELRDLLHRVEVLAVKPAQCDTDTIPEAIKAFAQLINERTEGMIQLKTFVGGNEVKLK